MPPYPFNACLPPAGGFALAATAQQTKASSISPLPKPDRRCAVPRLAQPAARWVGSVWPPGVLLPRAPLTCSISRLRKALLNWLLAYSPLSPVCTSPPRLTTCTHILTPGPALGVCGGVGGIQTKSLSLPLRGLLFRGKSLSRLHFLPGSQTQVLNFAPSDPHHNSCVWEWKLDQGQWSWPLQRRGWGGKRTLLRGDSGSPQGGTVGEGRGAGGGASQESNGQRGKDGRLGAEAAN